MRKERFNVVIPIVVICFSFFQGVAQSKEEVIERYFKTLGGRDNWERIKTKVSSGYSIDSKTGTRSEFSFFHKAPNLKKFVRIENADTSMTCFDGKNFMRMKDGIVQQADAIHSGYIGSTSFLGYADVLKDPAAKIEYLGQREFRHQLFEVLSVQRVDWVFGYDFYFHPETGIQAVIKSSAQESFTEISDYKSIQSALFHHEEKDFDKEGFLRSKTTYTSVIINVPIEDNFFCSTKLSINYEKED